MEPTRVPTFLSDYADELNSTGEAAFAQTHPHSVLVVTGVVGALAEQVPLNRTLVTEPAGLSVQSVVGLIGRVFPLVKGKYSSPGPISLGRTPDNDVTIPESSISARHCFLRVLGAEISLTDAGSTNGTLVNGVKLPAKKAQTVLEGDVITLGRFNLGFHTPRGFIKTLRDR